MVRLFRPALLGVALLAVPAMVTAQRPSGPGFLRGWEQTGKDFSPNGVWRSKGRAVAALRAQALARRDFASLTAPVAMGAPRASSSTVGGVLRMPALLFSFASTAVPQPFPNTDYATALFAGAPPTGRSYTLRTFYEQMSNGVFSMQGDVYGWTALPLAEASYTGQPGACPGAPNGGNCNGIFSGNSTALLQAGMAQVVQASDGAVNFGIYDNDGPDGTPNSGDDDGFVDVTIFLQAEVDGACGGGAANNHPWAHRYVLLTPYTTNDARTGGGNIRVRDYILQSAVGGSGSCTAGQLMPVGTAAHELGHGLGLPDLYDTGNNTNTEGIGQWGLMGSGNYTSAFSPARMESWSLNELGWITLAPLTSSGTYTLGAVPVSDSAFVITPKVPNPRNEYFLVENRQAVQADSALIRIHCTRSGNPVGCGGGVLIWHVDPTKLASGAFNNDVNVGAVHGLSLVEADGLNNLVNGDNRGDAGDVYPGTTANTSFTPTTAPAARLNLASEASGPSTQVYLSNIQLTGGNRDASFRLDFAGAYLVASNDTAARLKVDGTGYSRFEGGFVDGTSHELSMDSPQLSTDGRRRFTYQSWSDGGAQTHTVAGVIAGDTINLTVSREFKIIASASGTGTVTPGTPLDLAGAFVAAGTGVTLTAAPGTDAAFVGWSGDTTTANAVLVLPMGRPYTVVATFQTALVITSALARPAGTMGAPYADTLAVSGGTGGGYTWAVTSGALPTGLTLSAGGVVSGIPSVTGDFTYTATVTAQGQTTPASFTLTVAPPTLVQGTVVTQILGGGAALTTDQVRYLDLLGNHNGSFDLGDFLAWVRATGATGALEAYQRGLASPAAARTETPR